LHSHGDERSTNNRLQTFQAERRHLLSIAFRILGSQADAEDVVQETWIRYDRADTSDVQNLPAWLATVASRLCVDFLRRRRDVPQEETTLADELRETQNGPEETALLASELTAAFTVVLEELTPPQRVALVLHDAFGTPFDDIAHILGTTRDSAKKLASRARDRVRRRAAVAPRDRAGATRLVQAFLEAVRSGNVDALVKHLDANVIRLADPQVLPSGAPQHLQGVHAVVKETVGFRTIASRAHVSTIDGQPGIVVYSGGDLQLAIVFMILDDRIVQFDVIADPQRLAVLHTVASSH
jgi:RNA polymerase sigma factor (sigma-70 family)